MKTISNEKFLSRASNKMDIASDDANLVPKASQEAGERKVVIAVDKESYGGEEATHDNVPNVNKSDPEQNKNIKMEQEEKITLTEDTEIAYNKQILEDNAVEEIPVSETKPCESVTECTAISSKEKDPNISEAAVSSTMMLAQSKDISESTETVAVTITNGEEVAKAPEVDVVITADKGECVDKLNDKCQENAEGGQELLENLDRVEKDTDVAAKEDVNELRKTAYVIEKKDVVIKDQPVESNIAIESEKIVEIDKPASEQISNTVIIEDALQKVEVENTQKREGNIENTQKEEPFIEEIPVSKDNELSKDEENKKFERNLACENTLIDSRECGKLNDSTITETDEKKSQAKPIPIQVSNEPLIAEVLKEAGNGENIANTSAHDTLENIDKKTEAPKDSSGAIATDVTNPNEDSVPKSSAVVDVQDEIKCTVDKRPSNPIEKLVKSIDKITEIIEIDDDDEEMLAKNQNNKIDEDMSKDEASNATVSEKENQMIHCVENKINNSENNAVAKTCASMHTMPVIFYNKECINFECSKNHKEFHRAPQFAMNYFKVVKKKIKIQYICGECYDMALNFYQGLCGMINAKQPILLRDIASKKQEFVEILDSSDEEDNSANDTENMEKENTSFSKTDLILIETELENAIRNTFNRVEIQKQLTWSKTIFTERVQKMQEELEYIDEELREKQNLADKMYNNLYESGKYRISTLKPIDLDNENTENNIQQVPPYGEIIRPPIKLGDMYYAAKHKAIACWIPCRAVEPLDVTQVGSQKNVPNFKVKFINTQYQTYKNLSAKLIAYYDPPSVRLSVGQRVIAFFDGTTLSRDKDKCTVQSAFYPGIIAEEMKPNNFFRYLIFYDDGYTQYVSHKHVRLVCHVARNVWEDVDQSSREFIQKYIMEYRVNRPMVQTHKGQKMATESNGRWVPARVIDIDCSLVRMQFEGPNKNHKEWIYRGSLRLNPVYMEYQKSKSNQATQLPISRLPRRTEPFIRYTEDEENIGGSLGLQQRGVNRSDTLSSAKQSPKVRHLNANTIYLEDENRPKGKVIYYTAKRQLPTKTYRPHKCGPDCLIVVPHNLNGYSPLAKPLLSGWERIFLRQKAKKRVFYRAPCGKCFRDMTEVHQYLRLTKNTLNVDSFDFYPETSCLAEFEAENINLRKRDISKGQEKMPLPLVNYYDDSLPECTYSAKVIPTEGVNINTNPDFLICCDCEDDCVDKEKCACWQLTIEGVRSINPEVHIDDIGYQYKRLYEHLPTGIYECNSRCKCKSHCINRVVQHSLEMKLQVFKTSNRGWGLRCLNDIPRGSFVCIYAGNLLTESKANEGGLDAGDEYFAELDYIETVEQLKEGYESDVETQEDEEDEEPYLPDDDDEFRPGKSFLIRSKRSQRQSSGEGERQAINFNPNAVIQDDTKKKRPSVRQFFGKDEAVYVMDAKVTGNLGRYFNHSCSPNLFVQNVFVDTHDVRFPWVAFFSLVHIRAGTELTWNYNYEVGVVPGKVLYCQCGAPNCRQRLL